MIADKTMEYTQPRMAVRLLLLAWPLAGTLLLAGCAAPEPLIRDTDAAAAAASDEVPLRTVADDLLASGQPAPSQWTSIRARGVTTVINLRPDHEMAGRDEASEVAAAGMSYRQLGIDGADDVTDANAARIRAWIDEAPGPVLLHCSSGNRAGALLAVIAQRNGMPPAAALALGRRAGLTGLEPSVRALILPAAAETRWPENGWNAIDTRQSYPELLSRLKEAVSESDLNLVFDVGPTEAAANRGIDIPGNRVIGVFNNRFAVDILRLSVPAMIEAPIRFYVTEREDGHATLSWIEPSHIYAPYIDALDDREDARELREKANALDLLFARIATRAAQNE